MNADLINHIAATIRRTESAVTEPAALAETIAADLEQAGLLRGESTPTEVELARIVADIDRMARQFDTPSVPVRVVTFVADIKNLIAGR